MFEPLPSRFDFPESEEGILRFWEQNQIFEKSLEARREAPRFVFYEGPPTANGLPHPGHCLTRAIKDLFPRYQTMCGKLVERKAGWDTHGLPVEVEVCKELGIHTKEEIEQFGVEKFVRRCIDSVFKYVREWEQMTRRLGFWVNLEEAYVTFHQSYVESVWWGLKTLFERELLYQGHKVVWWWAQGGTALSAGEVGEGYRTVQDPSVYVRFPLVKESAQRVAEQIAGVEADKPISLLVWTTTPWTLISNHFAAVGPDISYALVYDKVLGEYLYIAEALVDTTMQKLKHEYETVGVCKGEDLVDLRYVPPFPDVYWKKLGEQTAALKDGGAERLGWRVTLADFVTLESGTGLVHEAPAYGEVDFDLLQTERKRFTDELNSIPLINAVGPDGKFTDEAPEEYRGRWVKDCDKDIIRELKERGVLLHQETIEHEYPFCPRAEEDPLIQYARRSWFVRTSQFKDEFLKNNAGIYWLPDHIREGRFGDFLRNNVDWALSRERFWGTPLPIWKCDRCGRMEAVGSLAELKAKPGASDATAEYPQGMWATRKGDDPELPDHLMVHKPYIDAWTYPASCCDGARMVRVPEVIDCWWDAGSMPFAQFGFPHVPGSCDRFGLRFPAHFISEALDQTRGWFYGLLAISTLLFGRENTSIDVPGGSGAGVSPAVDRAPEFSPFEVRDALHIRYRRRLPHWEAGGRTYFVTFRIKSGELSPTERTLVLEACRHWDEDRLLLHAVVVMPDHVHLLVTPLMKSSGEWWALSELMHGIKSFSAHGIAESRGETGPVWQDDRFDHIIRSQEEFEEKADYIAGNPQARALGEDYQWVWVDEEVGDGGNGGRDARPTSIASDFPHPYKACIVLGLMMGEDGLKMSKRKKNYREPSVHLRCKYGADAIALVLLQRADAVDFGALRGAEHPRRAARVPRPAVQRLQLLQHLRPNIDGFVAHPQNGSPIGGRRRSGTNWTAGLSAELHRTTQFVREKPRPASRTIPAAGRLNEFVDALSQLVRPPEPRSVLEECAKDQPTSGTRTTRSSSVLVTLSKLIAPFTPFFAETMYQNLVAKLPGVDTQQRPTSGADHAPYKVAGDSNSAASNPNWASQSVHLCEYPSVDSELIDESLAQEMELVRQVVSLGRSARTSAKLKVRQPLALVEIILARQDHAAWLEAHSELIAEELNIKQVEFTTEADHYVTYQLKPEFKALGPKFGKLAPQVAAAVQKLDAAEARAALDATGEVIVEVEGQPTRLSDQEVQVRLEARPGWSAAQGRAGVVVVKTELTPELAAEGLIRELIHHVQGLRKQAELPYEARIVLHVDTDPELQAVVERFADTIRRECLADEIRLAPSAAGGSAGSEGRKNTRLGWRSRRRRDDVLE